MEQILHNLQDISWWFTGLFFCMTWFFFKKIGRGIIATNQRLKKRRKLSTLKIVKNNRQHDLKIQWMIGRYWALSTVSLGLLIFSSVLFFFTPSISNKLSNMILPALLFTISYGALFFIDKEKQLMDELIRANIKWRKKRNY